MTKLEQINLSNALNSLASSTEELKKYWEDYLKQEYDSGDDLDNRFFFEDMNKIADYIVEKWKQKKTGGFKIFFDSLENIFTTLDLNTCSCISAGLIEGIQSYKNIDYNTEFNEWLKPKTKEWWNDAIDYWKRSNQVNTNGS